MPPFGFLLDFTGIVYYNVKRKSVDFSTKRGFI
jgi:hypothetical protein